MAAMAAIKIVKMIILVLSAMLEMYGSMDAR
jgi:hypothetical protein